MVLKKCQNTTLTVSSEKAPQSINRGISRRQFVHTSAGVVAAGALLGKRAFASPRPLKIGYVSPETGALAPFAESDAFVVDQIRKMTQGGIQSGGTTRQIELLVRDSQSDPNRCSQVAAELIKSDKVDLMVAAGTSDTVNPVADQCEVNQVPCVSSDAPWQAFYFGRGGKPDKGFDWTYHFFWGIETISENFADIMLGVPTNKVVGMFYGDDLEGSMFTDKATGFPPIWEKRGLTIFDPGRFHLNSNDFSAQISAFKNAKAEILQGIVPFPTFSNFWAQAAQQGYRPKIALVGKALLFASAVDALGPRGKDLTCDIWWSPAYPFKSSLTGQSARQVCDVYEEVTKKQWPQALGFRYALYEVGLNAFKRVQNPESPASLIEAIRTTKLDTIVGPLQWQGPPPNQWTQNPVKNVCTTPEVGGQWVPGKKWQYDIVVVTNARYPPIPVERKMVPLPG